MYERIDHERQKLVGRNTRWGNPFPVRGAINSDKPPRLVTKYAAKWNVTIDELLSATDKAAVERYRQALVNGELDYGVEAVREALCGYDLGCPCGAKSCHADVLLEIANS